MMVTDIPRESFLILARHRKAVAIAAVLNDFHTPADVVLQLTPERRRQIETIAGVKVSSDITWGVVSLILHHEQGRPITIRPATTIAEIHEAIQRHAEQYGAPGRARNT